MSKRLGIIIGINNYQDTPFQPLTFAENDARALAQWLVNTRGGNWNPSNIQLLIGEQATTKLAESLIIQSALNIADHDDLVFIYFAGHAFVDDTTGEGYLAFVNTHMLQPTTALSLHSLFNQAMLHSSAAQIVFIVDSYQTGLAWNRSKTSLFDFKPLLGPTLQYAIKQAQGRLLYCSCRGNEYAPEAGEKSVGKLLYHMIIGLSNQSDPVSGQVTLQNLHAFLLSSLGEQHQPQVFGQEHRPVVLVGDMHSFAYKQESAAAPPPQYSPLDFSATSNKATEHLSQSAIGIANAQMSPITSGQSSIEILEQNRRNSYAEHDRGSQSASTSISKQGGIKSFLLATVIQISALIMGIIGASILVIRPQLPIIIAFTLESVALSILCVNAALGAYLYGIKRFLLTLTITLLTLGIVGALYRFGYHWLVNKVIALPPLIVPVLFLGFWLVAAAILPLLLALGGLLSGIVVGARRKRT